MYKTTPTEVIKLMISIFNTACSSAMYSTYVGHYVYIKAITLELPKQHFTAQLSSCCGLTIIFRSEMFVCTLFLALLFSSF